MSYQSVQGHSSMVFDDVRNRAYERALRQCITPDSVVLDLGAGLGLFGVLAAKLGAKQVYLVEPQPVIRLAEKVAAANGVAERIKCLQGRIEDVEIPEKVDVIVSVLTGNFLLLEDLLPSLYHARDRWLKPGGKMIPDAAVMEVAPVSQAQFYQKHIDDWSVPQVGIDCAVGRACAVNSIHGSRGLSDPAVQLADQIDIAQLDLTTSSVAECRNSVEFDITKAGTCHAICGWFRMRLGKEWLSTGPEAEKVHWQPVLLPLAQTVELSVGDQATFQLVRPEHGDWTWRFQAAGVDQKHSTAFAMPISSAELRKTTAEYAPSLNANGVRLQTVMQLFDAQRTVDEIATEFSRVHPELKWSHTECLRFVRNTVDLYG